MRDLIFSDKEMTAAQLAVLKNCLEKATEHKLSEKCILNFNEGGIGYLGSGLMRIPCSLSVLCSCAVDDVSLCWIVRLFNVESLSSWLWAISGIWFLRGFDAAFIASIEYLPLAYQEPQSFVMKMLASEFCRNLHGNMPRSMQGCLQHTEIQLLSLPVLNFLEISLRDGGFCLKLTNVT